MLTQPWWLIGWDVFAWIGHRRFSRHWSIKQIELKDTHDIILSHDTIGLTIQRYQAMFTAREQDPTLLRQQYCREKGVILMVDGLQPEKGHETLYVIREYHQKRVWFAEALLSSTQKEIKAFLHRVHAWVEIVGKPIQLWISDKQKALVQGIAAEFPGTPHRYCAAHFLRDVSKPILDADSHAKVVMRKKVRGLRTIEKEIVEHQKADPKDSSAGEHVQAKILKATGEVKKIAETLEPKNGAMAKREKDFWKLQEAFEGKSSFWDVHMAKVMAAFAPGLFVGPEDGPTTNDDLKRSFRIPKGHERRIHGHRHAGIRIVIEGPTLLPALDAHVRHPEPFHPGDLLQFSKAVLPKEQLESIKRRKTMRKARSKKNPQILLANLEKRHKEDG